MRIAVLTDTVGWQGEALRAAFDRRGIEVAFVSLRQCRFDTRAPQGLCLPDFEDCLPDGVFVRQVAGGTLEQVVLRLDVLHALQSAGVLVYNNARVIECTVDKAMTSWLLHRAGLPTPLTWAAESDSGARDWLGAQRADCHEAVAKPLFGSQGKGLRRVGATPDTPRAEEFGGVLYLQQFLPPADDLYRSWRVFVIDDRAVAAMQRSTTDWISNVAQGAHCTAVEPVGELADLAVAAGRAVESAYAGVDIMQGTSGAWQVIEVNGIPAWQGLQSVSAVNIADELVASFIARC